MRLQAGLLINSGSRLARRQSSEVLAALNKHQVEVVHVYEVTRKHRLDQILAEVRRRKPQLLIIGG